MSRIPSAFIDDLINRLDIVDIIDHRVKLKRAGKNYSACCPFHQEKTPSFTVSPDKQFYYCFGCGATGNALGFLMEYENLGFIDAVESLAKHAGMEVPREENKFAEKRDSRLKQLYKILERASDFYQNQLREHPLKDKPVSYLKNRGLSGAIAKLFGIGFAPPGHRNLLQKLGQNEEAIEQLIDTGLVIKREDDGRQYDRFRFRIMFPIRDIRGRTIGFGGRVLGDDKPKYLNSPETEVFHKSRELYGLYEARQANRKLDQLVVVEGYMDVIALAQYGINNAVATMGTACGEDHLKLAFRFVSEIVFCFDGDNAGRNAAKRALTNSLNTMEDGRQIKFLFLPEGQDPDSLVRQIGAERFKSQLENAVPLEEFLFEAAAENIDTSTMEGRARFSKVAAPLVAMLPEGIFRELMFDNLAKRTGLSPEVLRELQKEKVQLTEPLPKSTPASHSNTAPRSMSSPPAGEPSTANLPDDQSPPIYDPADIPDEIPYEQIPADYLPFSPPFDNNTPQKTFQRGDEQTFTFQYKSSVSLSSAKVATILLLENPKLLSQIGRKPSFKPENDDLLRLNELIDYLDKRPDCNFNTILGYWGGSKGVEEQQNLAKLLANQLMSNAKTIETYDPLSELQNALNKIESAQLKAAVSSELAILKAKGLENLSPEEKNRFRELTKR
ncbi:DNA primase [Thalassocella blandensis]|nr:DNA primase [Thalassocella blandensis]